MLDSSVTGNLSIFMALMEGLISFFSPCVIPLLPIYLGYLTGTLEEEKPSRKKSLGFTFLFILGIFTALFLLNISISWIAVFFQNASIWFSRIGGCLIVLLGLLQLGIWKLPFLERTFHFHLDLQGKRMNFALAFVMGFTFSFSWTPCIGPALASILIMAGSSGSLFTSSLLVFAYAIGFALPFLFLSFFAQKAVTFFRSHDAILQVIVKLGALLLIVMGMLMISGHLSALGVSQQAPQGQEEERISAPSFTFRDQYGEQVSLSDYQGKIVYLNFWGTWCSACKSELDDLQKLYETYKDSEAVAILTIVYPNIGEEQDIDGIKYFLDEHGYRFPVLFDEHGVSASAYGIRSFPTMFAINPDQSVFGYFSGAIPYEAMEHIIQQVRDQEAPASAS